MSFENQCKHNNRFTILNCYCASLPSIYCTRKEVSKENYCAVTVTQRQVDHFINFTCHYDIKIYRKYCKYYIEKIRNFE